MNLLFSINPRALPLLLSCMKSIAISGGETHYDAYILHSSLTQADCQRITAAAPPCFACRFIAVPEALFESFPETRRYPREIYYRIAAPLLLPGDIGRILYLDVDTVVINPLRSLYDMDFQGAYYIACTHAGRILTKVNQLRLKTERTTPYINTGVMLLNLPPLRRALRLSDVRSYVGMKRHALLLPDQDILTALYGGHIRQADPLLYNLSNTLLLNYSADPRNPRIDLDWIRQHTVIIHYCGRNKPWREHYVGTLGVFYQELSETQEMEA